MKNLKLPALRIGDLLASLPIIQGGMGVGISLSGLSSAVANQGGIGVIAVAGIGMAEPDFLKNYMQANIRALREEIRKARSMSKGIIGVNIMVALSNFGEYVATAIQEGVDIIFAGAGLPLNLPSYLSENVKTKLVPIVSSAKAASLLTRRWYEKYCYVPDALVVEGPHAGGHLGFKPEQIEDPAFQLERLVVDVLKETVELERKYGKKIPVIAAGGIYTGADIRKFLDLGASGVQMATRFVTTTECDAADAFKQTYLSSKEQDITIIKSPVGLPGRAIKNNFLCEVEEGEKKPFFCPFHCIVTCDYKNAPYCIASALIHAKKGDFSQGFAFSGANAWRANKIISVDELIKKIRTEFEESAQEPT
jgi:nitronate monooxygenase